MSFKWSKLLWKVLQVVAPVLVALGATVSVPDDFSDFQKNSIFVTIAIVAGIMKAADNLRKNWDRLSGDPHDFRNFRGTPPTAGVILILIGLLVLPGCASSMTKFIDGTDGSSVTMFDTVPIGMKRDLSAQNGEFEWQGDGSGAWTVGSNLESTDGTEVFEKLLDTIGALAPFLNALAQAQATGPPPAAPSNEVEWLDTPEPPFPLMSP